MNECTHTTKITGIILVKKGMAAKALKNNLQTGNKKKLAKQVEKGTVKIYKNN